MIRTWGVLAPVAASVVAAGCARLPRTVSPPVVAFDEIAHPDPGADLGIATDGAIAFVDVVTPSGVAILDAAAVDAVEAAAPFEAVPAVILQGKGVPLRLRTHDRHAATPLLP
jgi:hypothetical protein